MNPQQLLLFWLLRDDEEQPSVAEPSTPRLDHAYSPYGYYENQRQDVEIRMGCCRLLVRWFVPTVETEDTTEEWPGWEDEAAIGALLMI